MVERKRKKSTEKDKSIKQTTKESATKIINTNTIKIVIDNKKPQRKTNGSSSGGKKKKAIEALKAALEKFAQLKNLAKEKSIALPAKLGESPSNINQVNSIAEIEALTSDINNRIIMIERLLQGQATPQQPQNLLGGEFAPRITPSPVEPAQPQQPAQPPTPATQPDTSPQEYPQTSGDGVSDSDIANTLKEIADTVKSKAGKEGLDTGDGPPDIPSGMGVDTNPQRGNATDPASNPLDIPPAQITPFNQELKNLSDKVSSLSLKLRTLEKFDAVDTKTEKAQIDLALPLYIEASNIEGELNNLEAQAKGNDFATVNMLLNDYDFEIGGLSIKGVDELIEKFQLFLSSRGYAFEDGQNPDEKEEPPVKKEDPPVKKYDEDKDPLLTDKRNYVDTLSTKLKSIARDNDKLDMNFVNPSKLSPGEFTRINKTLNDEQEALTNWTRIKNGYLRDLDPNKDDENKIIKDINVLVEEHKTLRTTVANDIVKLFRSKGSMVIEPDADPEKPTKLKKGKKKLKKVKGDDVTSYFDDILNVPADYEKQPTPAPFLNMSSKLRNLQGYSVDSFIDFENLVVKSLGKSPDKSLDIGILKSKMDDLESARQLRLADLIKYQKAIVDNNITLTPQQQSILDAYKRELSFTTKKLVKILVNKNKPGKTIGIFDNQGNAIGLIN